jgi:NAD(P)-dependent dehydrogenase (short-subunit alcohol dehydrogenase family)
MIRNSRKSENSNGDKAVFVTGCSSGIGRATAVSLAEGGFTVFATVRKERDVAALRELNLPRLVPVCPLDLTRQAEISQAAGQVSAELRQRNIRGLYGLVHNAGGSSVGPVELMGLEKFGQELQARILGSVALTQAFLPLLRQAGGRIVWIVTPALIPTSYVASIHACDFAVNCIARTLDIELKPWNIPNILVRCGGIKTRAGMNTTADLESARRGWPADGAALYQKQLDRWVAQMADFDRHRSDPEQVGRLVYRSLTARNPRRRYATGYLAHTAAFLELLPPPLCDAILKGRE